MTESIYFYKLNPEEFYNNDFPQALTDEFKILKCWFEEKKIDLDNDESLQSKLLEEINFGEVRLSAKSDKIKSLLGLGERILNKDSSFYFIDKILWAAIKSTFFEEIDTIANRSSPISTQEIYDKYLRRFAITESLWENHNLIIRVI